MSKRANKKEQKIVISIISALILLALIIFGSSPDTINQFANTAGINITMENSTAEEKTTTNNPVEGDLTVYFIDVGQADSILVVNKDEAMLIDAGNNEDGQDVANFIKEKGITKLDYVIRNPSS